MIFIFINLIIQSLCQFKIRQLHSNHLYVIYDYLFFKLALNFDITSNYQFIFLPFKNFYHTLKNLMNDPHPIFNYFMT